MNNNVFKFTCGYGWSLKGLYMHIRQFFLNIKYAYQRATRGYCDRDLWNLDDFYCQMFINTLIDFNNSRVGYPGQKPFETEEKWDDYLNKMINCFQDVKEYQDFIFDDPTATPEEFEERYQKGKADIKKALTMLSKCYFSLWD